MKAGVGRRFPIGAELLPDGRVHVRVWAPAHKRVTVAHGPGLTCLLPLAAEKDADGMFSGTVDGLSEGTTYAFRLDDDPHPYPDPASRFQPEGPHGPSELIDPTRFRWTDQAWKGLQRHGQVLYELHVGTFTPEGTYAAAAERLPALAELGVTVIEMMPVSEFAGRFGWGYDGVDLWAPTHLYGRPDDLRRFVDRAHGLGMGVILDVVYNHFGPDGNYLTQFSKTYFTDKYDNEWGDAINFDGQGSTGARLLCIENAGYWVQEFHFDGLRLDATQQIFDGSPDHLVAAVGRRVRAAAGTRSCLLVAENEPQETRMVRAPEAGGYGLDALWNDDFHHSARVALTGHNEAYYSDYRGTPQEILSAVKWGYLYQGQRYAWQKKRRGTPALDLPATAFVTFLENHDQVANSVRGQRLATLAAPGLLRAMTAVILLGPSTPMLFQGQEWGSTRPWVYFADHKPELAKAVNEGRRKFLAQFPSCASDAAQAVVMTPHDPATFEACKLDWSERERHAGTLALHRDLLRLRREDPAFSSSDRGCVNGAVVDREALVLRFTCPAGDRLLIVNLGRDLVLPSVAEPLLAPPFQHGWRTLWSSEDPRYGGQGTAGVETEAGFVFPGQAALVLVPEVVA